MNERTHKETKSDPSMRLLRKLLLSSRKRQFEKSDRSRHYGLWDAYIAMLQEAPASLHSSDYGRFFFKLGKMFRYGLVEMRRLPPSVLILNRWIKRETKSFEAEIHWAAKRVLFEVDSVKRFVEARDIIERSLYCGKYQDALEELEGLEGKVGPSIWSIEATLSILQLYQGIEIQKSYVEKLRAQLKGGLVPFLCFFFSVRNESSVTSLRYLDNTARALTDIKDLRVRKYAEYKLLGRTSRIRPDNATILSVENQHSVVDVYETLMVLLQQLTSAPTGGQDGSLIRAIVDELPEVGDHRLLKLKLAQRCVPPSQVVAESAAATELLISGELGRAAEIFRADLRLAPNDSSRLIFLACALAGRRRRAPPVIATDAAGPLALTQRIASVLRKDAASEAHVEWLTKYTQNLSGFPSMRALSLLLEREMQPAVEMHTESMKKLCLNVPGWSLLDGLAYPELAGAIADRIEDCGYVVTPALIRASTVGRETALLPNSLRAYIGALTDARDGRDRSAAAAAVVLVGDSNPLIAARARLLAIQSFGRLGDVRESTLIAANEIVSGRTRLSALPLAEVFVAKPWFVLKPHFVHIETLIALHAWWRNSDSSEALTVLSRSFDRFLMSAGVTKASELPGTWTGDVPKLVYFLREVCIEQVIDMSSTLPTSLSVDIERQAILGELRILDPANQGIYDEQILNLTYRIHTQKGLEVFDGSRIHVDTGAIRSQLRASLSESLARYTSLVSAGVGVAEDIEVVIRQIHRTSQSREDSLTIPKSEADNLLMEMITTITEPFLHDELHGLDSYLSRRIRHGSLVSHLRSPVEKEELIVQRDEKAKYPINEVWLSRFEDVGLGRGPALAAAFRKFADSYDSAILGVRDRLMHIRSRAKPEGLFSVLIDGPAFHLMRSALQLSPSIDTLFESAFVIIWRSLETSLQSARVAISDRLASRLQDILTQLRADIKAIAGDSSAYAQFTDAARRGSEALRVATESVGAWFIRTSAESDSTTFTLRQAIDTAAEAAHVGHKKISIRVEVDDPRRLQVSPTGLGVLCEFFLVVLSNAAEHSRLDHRTLVTIRCQTFDDADVLAICVENDVADSSRTRESEHKLAELRRELQQRDFRKMRTEGSSGLVKVAALADSPDQLSFGFVGDSTFRVEIRLLYTLVNPSCVGFDRS